MNANEYQKLAMTTLNKELSEKEILINGVMGLCGESGEVIDLVKKWYAHGHELDRDKLVKELGDIAKRNKIKHQYEILLAGGTDTSSMQMAGGGCSACCLSVPTRYIHSNHELLDLGDVEACVELAKAYILGK